MESVPLSWILVEEWENNFIFENTDNSFSVNITYTERCSVTYSISFSQLKGIYTVIGFEDGAYSTNATTLAEAIEKAIIMMLFIDKLAQDKSDQCKMTIYG
jgi:hypothetical protein